jgi:RND family efflux transporter MFP subunit
VTCLALASGCERAQPKLAPKKDPSVLYSTPVTQEITDFEDFTGRTDAVFSINVMARVSGYLDHVYFKDGDEVDQGDLLFKIDPRQYKAALDQAEANVAVKKAHFDRLERDRKRAVNLMARNAIGREEYDLIMGNHGEAAADLGVAKATLDMAELNWEWTDVKAPISGRLSRRLVDPGNLVRADETILTTIVSQDPMYVYFDIDERTLLRIRRLVQEGKLQSRQEGAVIKVLLGLSDELDLSTGQFQYLHEGIVNFSDNKVDPSTGTLRVRAEIPNPKPRVFSPGMYMHVRLPIGKPHKALVIAEQAMGTDQGRKYVYVINDKNEAVYRPVKVGTLNAGLRVVEEGLSPGERVIVSGLQRVRPGIKVDPKPYEEKERKIAEGEGAKGKMAQHETKAPTASSTPVGVKQPEVPARSQAPKG